MKMNDSDLFSLLERAKGHDKNADAYINSFDVNRRSAARLGVDQLTADKTQILYVLANLSHWRGEEAREVKAKLIGYDGDVNASTNRATLELRSTTLSRMQLVDILQGVCDGLAEIEESRDITIKLLDSLEPE